MGGSWILMAVLAVWALAMFALARFARKGRIGRPAWVEKQLPCPQWISQQRSIWTFLVAAGIVAALGAGVMAMFLINADRAESAPTVFLGVLVAEIVILAGVSFEVRRITRARMEAGQF